MIVIPNQVSRLLKDKITLVKLPEGPDLALVGPVRLPVQLEEREITFNWYTWLRTESASFEVEDVLHILPFADLASYQQSSVLVYGDFANAEHTLIRMHSICHTGDIFGSKRCDCGYQLRRSMNMIVDNGGGALFYLANHEGRGIGLFSKSLAYLLQEEGYDTVEANHALGFPDDLRSYDEAIQVLQALRQKPVSLITNNPRKLQSLREKGLASDHHVSIWGDVSKHNTRYLATKIEKSGHIYNPLNETVQLG